MSEVKMVEVISPQSHPLLSSVPFHFYLPPPPNPLLFKVPSPSYLTGLSAKETLFLFGSTISVMTLPVDDVSWGDSGDEGEGVWGWARVCGGGRGCVGVGEGVIW